jgi:hypothetical protein
MGTPLVRRIESHSASRKGPNGLYNGRGRIRADKVRCLKDIAGNRPAVQIALHLITPQQAERVCLLFGFDPLRHQFEAERLTEAHNGGRQRQATGPGWHPPVLWHRKASSGTLQPRVSWRARDARFSLAVMKMMGVAAEPMRFWRRSATTNPSPAGREMSKTTTSGLLLRTADTALIASFAVYTMYPMLFSCSALHRQQARSSAVIASATR